MSHHMQDGKSLKSLKGQDSYCVGSKSHFAGDIENATPATTEKKPL